MKEFKFIDNTKVKVPKSSYPNVKSIGNGYEEEGNYKDFFDFGNGAYVDDEDKQRWINEIMDFMNEHPEQMHCSIATGRSKVIGLRRVDEIEILVIDKYMEACISLE